MHAMIRDVAVPATQAIVNSLKPILPHHVLVQARDTIYAGVEGALLAYEQQCDPLGRWWRDVSLN